MNIVESPVDSKLFLKIKKNNSFILKEIALTQIFNYRITENKKPVYSFNNLEFEQVIRGKRLIECAIVIKKSVVSELWKIINSESSYSEYLNQYIKDKIQYVKSISNGIDRIENLVKQYERDNLEYNNLLKNTEAKGNAIDILSELPEDMELLISFGTYKQQDVELENKDDFTEEEIISYIEKNSKLLIKNINFYEYSGEINISNTGIDEVFKMFGQIKK